MSASEPPKGLRERKKARTRAAIQDHALRLFVRQGYTETTIEQIAEAAEVSPSTFFRYFPTKEDTVLYDPLDPRFVESFLNQPAELEPLAAMRAALYEVFNQLSEGESELERERQRLVFSQPELRGALLDLLSGGMALTVDAVAERVGREPEDPRVRTFCGAVIGVVISAFIASMDGGIDAFLENFDAGLTLLRDGLPL